MTSPTMMMVISRLPPPLVTRVVPVKAAADGYVDETNLFFFIAFLVTRAALPCWSATLGELTQSLMMVKRCGDSRNSRMGR